MCIMNNNSAGLATVVHAPAHHACATRPRWGENTGGGERYGWDGGHEDAKDTGAQMMGVDEEEV